MKSPVQVLLAVLDDAWSHPWEGLLYALDGLQEEEATWQAPYYRMEESDSGVFKVGSVLWHMDHLRSCKDVYTAQMIGKEQGPKKERGDDSLASIRAELESSHQRQRGALEGLSDDDLQSRTLDGVPFEEVVRANIRHDTWHAGQIVVARRAWRVGR